MLRIFVCWLVVLVSAKDNYSRVVTIESGLVRGYKDAEYDIFVFNGIPYATAPKGIYKFRAPLPAPVWKGTFDATEAHIMCPQYQIFEGHDYYRSHKIREDCLVANIYVPNSEENLLPVLVDIHGGRFQMGYGNMLTLKKLVKTKRVIVVSFNYRLGAHGFLCLGTKDIPGNAGMKDMIALLRWVKNNIAAFGGNPNEVTITEYTTGNSAIDLLLLSPTAKGLFKRAIPESGPNLSIYSIQMDPIEVAKYYAKKLNFFDVKDIYALERFYQTLSFEGLTKEHYMAEPDESLQFVPCIERDLGEEHFLLHSPYDLSKMGSDANVSILYGYTDMKSTYKIEDLELWNKINNNFSSFLPSDLMFISNVEKASLALTVKEFYFGKEDLSYNLNSVQAFVGYITDIFYAYSTYRSVRLQVEAGNDLVFMYDYTFVEDEESEQYHVNLHMQGLGALLYEAKNLGVTDNQTESAIRKRVRKTVIELWLNFICEGAPVPLGSPLPVWPPATAEGHPFMSIGDSLELQGHQKKRWERMNFWHDIYDRYYRDPVPPPDRSSRNEL